MARSSSYIHRIARSVRAFQSYLLVQGKRPLTVTPDQRSALHYFLDTRAPEEDHGHTRRETRRIGTKGGGQNRPSPRAADPAAPTPGGTDTPTPRRDVLSQLGV